MKRKNLSREEMETLFNMICDEYAQEDNYKSVSIYFKKWPSIRKDLYKKLTELLDEYQMLWDLENE